MLMKYLIKEMLNNITDNGITNGSGYYSINSVFVKEDNLWLSGLAEIIRNEDNTYSVYSVAVINGGDDICDSNWEDAKNEEELLTIFNNLQDEVFSDNNLVKMYNNVKIV